MSETVDVKYSELQEKVGALVGLDPSKVTDEHITNAFTQVMDEIGKRAQEVTGDETNADVVLKNVDFGELKEAILANAEERRAAKNTSLETDPRRRLSREAADAGKGAADVWDKVKKAGTIMHALRMPETATMRYLLETPSTDEKVKAVQRFNDDMQLMASMMGRRTSVTMEGLPEQCEENLFPGFDNIRLWNEFKGHSPAWAKAMNETDNAQWVPTFYSDDFIQTIYQTTNVLGRLRRIDFPRNVGGTMAIPVEGSDLHAYGASEATTDDGAAKFTASTASSGTSVTVTPKTLAVRTVLSWEMEEDSIVNSLDLARAKIVRAFAMDLDDALVNGAAPSGTHHDSDTAAAPANDRRKLWTGYVSKALTNTGANVSMSTNYNIEYLTYPLLKMGVYCIPGETVLIVSPQMAVKLGYITNTGGYPVYLRHAGSGLPNTPEMGRNVVPSTAGDFEIVQSSMVRNLVSVTGAQGGTVATDIYSVGLWVHEPSWSVAVARDVTIWAGNRDEQGQRVLVGTWRGLPFHRRATDLTTALLRGFSAIVP
jgi:HK97 family phage major capsid protein